MSNNPDYTSVVDALAACGLEAEFDDRGLTIKGKDGRFPIYSARIWTPVIFARPGSKPVSARMIEKAGGWVGEIKIGDDVLIVSRDRAGFNIDE